MAQNAKSTPSTPLNERGKKRAQAIIQAATKTFIEYGYEKTSLEMIIDQSGGSRSTIYAHFGDKKACYQQLLNP